MFLESLRETVKEEDILKHVLPPEMPPGKPHLIVCDERETISVVLSLYMHSADQPLPTQAEVLLCHEGTEQEDVELLLRRAIRDEANGR